MEENLINNDNILKELEQFSEKIKQTDYSEQNLLENSPSCLRSLLNVTAQFENSKYNQDLAWRVPLWSMKNTLTTSDACNSSNYYTNSNPIFNRKNIDNKAPDENIVDLAESTIPAQISLLNQLLDDSNFLTDSNSKQINTFDELVRYENLESSSINLQKRLLGYTSKIANKGITVKKDLSNASKHKINYTGQGHKSKNHNDNSSKKFSKKITSSDTESDDSVI